jgi:hypothetical protein
MAVALLAAVRPGMLAAQTDFYNTSVGRPLRVEDAIPVEYRAIELDIAPLRVDLFRGSTRQWSLHPETTIGILPRTQLQIGVPLTYVDSPVGSRRGLSGIEISVFHALNAETSIPALAVAANVLLPAGGLGGDATFGTFKAILTRTLPSMRAHANVEFTAGPGSVASAQSRSAARGVRDVSRWMAGLAIDKAFPFRSLLITAESFAEQPLDSGERVAWNAGTGIRYQLAPRWAMDAGVGRRYTGDDRAWYVTFGSAYVLGIR